jgi:hypothetical protein
MAIAGLERHDSEKTVRFFVRMIATRGPVVGMAMDQI